MFFGPNRIFLGFRITKNVGNLLECFLDPVGIWFLDLYIFVLDRGNLFFGCQINSFGARFLFFGPVDLFRGPCLQRMGGKFHCYRRFHWPGYFWTLAAGAFFF